MLWCHFALCIQSKTVSVTLYISNIMNAQSWPQRDAVNTMSLLTCAHLLKEEFVWEHLGKTFHRVGCSYLDFCLQCNNLSTKDRSKERLFALSLMPQQQGFNLLTQRG